MKNIGPTTARWLQEIGIEHSEQIRTLGAVAVYRCVKAQRPEANLNLLYALQGALMDIPWNDLPLIMREQLKKEVNQ